MTDQTVTQRDREAVNRHAKNKMRCGESLDEGFAAYREQIVTEVVAYIRSIEREDGLPFGWANQLLSGKWSAS